MNEPGTPERSPGALEGMRVLLVEDSALVAHELKRALAQDGCQVAAHCDTLESALLAASGTEEYSGALLDINLRGQLVYPAAEELQRRGIPLIFLTGYGAEFLPEIFGGCPLLEKPFSPSELRTAMLRTFSGRQN